MDTDKGDETVMSAALSVGRIILWYGLAIVAGVAAVWLRNLGLDPDVVSASSGMYAAGDLFLFTFVAGLVALWPTAAVLRALTRSALARDAYSWFVLAVAVTAGVAAVAICSISTRATIPF